MTQPGCDRLIASFRDVLDQVDPHMPECMDGTPMNSVPSWVASRRAENAVQRDTAAAAIAPGNGIARSASNASGNANGNGNTNAYLWWCFAGLLCLVMLLLAAIVFLLCRGKDGDASLLPRGRRRAATKHRPVERERGDDEDDDDSAEEDVYDDGEGGDGEEDVGRPPRLHAHPPATARKVAARRALATEVQQQGGPMHTSSDSDRGKQSEEDPLFQPLRRKDGMLS